MTQTCSIGILLVVIFTPRMLSVLTTIPIYMGNGFVRTLSNDLLEGVRIAWNII